MDAADVREVGPDRDGDENADTAFSVPPDRALFMNTPKTKEGGEINCGGTVFEEEAAEADGITVALLQNVGGKWTVVTHAFFTTDLRWHERWENYSGSPASISERI